MSPPPAADNNASSSSLANRADAASLPRAPSFFARLGARRPRTASKIHQVSFAASTSNLLSPSANGSSFSDLLRSSSSSQVHLASSRPGTNSPRPTRISLQTTYTSPTLERVPQGSSSGNTNMTSTNASSPQAGGSALGRMFRRYSQGGAARSDLQGRPSTRDRDSFSVSRNTSSSALDRDIGSPLRPSTHAAVSFPSVPRSNSAILSTVPSNDSGAGIPASRTLPTLAAAEAPAFPSPAIASAITNTQTLDSSSRANTASSANAIIAQPTSTVADTPVAAATGGSGTPTASRPLNGMHRIRLVPHLEATRSLHFEPIERDLKEGAGAVKVGRFTDRQPSQRDQLAATLAGATGANHDATSSGEFGSVLQTQSSRGQPGARGGAIPISGSRGGGGRIVSSRIAFKSKVVSRGHAEIWCEAGGKFFIRDTKSSSGTFLNHIRLSGPNMESRPFAIKDGDVVQLGVDYQGGTEEIYRCVKMRVELNRGWQREASQFNVNALRQLRALQGTPISPPEDKGKTASAAALLPTNRQGVSVTDCCICLFSVTVCQALFIAPCSHVFHYKCIRPLLNLHHPGFSCPLCRTFADLDADVEEDEAWQEALLQEAAAAEARLAQGKQPFEVGTPAVELDAPITAAMLPSLTSALTNGARADGPTTGSAFGRLPLATGSSALPAELHAAHATANPLLGRDTAALSKRKNDWARPDTAVGSSVGPLGGDKTFAMDDAAEPAGVSNDATHITAELGEMVVTDRLLNEDATVSVDPAALVPSAALQRTGPGAGDAGSPVRRGSGPIAIGNAHRAMPSSSSLARPTGLGSLEEGWPSVGAVGGFSPGLEESGTPLNHTFLSTLAEAPQVNTSSPSATTTTTTAAAAARNFPPGRSAPAQILVPATIHSAGTSRLRTTAEHGVSEGAVGEYGGRGKRSSDGGEDVDTAEEEMGGASLGAAFTNAAAHQKGKARLDTQVGESQHDVALGGDGSIKLPIDAVDRSPNVIIPTGARGRSRSCSRSRAGKEAIPSDSDDPFQPCEHPPVPRTGPNLNASAYMSHQQSTHGARQVSTDRSFNLDPTGGGNGSGDSVSSPTSPASESKMARFKRRISHAIILSSPQNSLAGLSDSIKALGNETKLSIDEINSKLGAFPTQFTQAIGDRFAQLSQQNERCTHEIVQEYAVPQLPAEGQLPSNKVMPLPAKQEAFATNKQDGGEVGLAQVTEDKINWSEDFNNATNNHKIFNASKDARIPKFHPYNDSTEETTGKWLQDFIKVLVDSRVSKSRWPVAISSCLEGSPLGWWHAFKKKCTSFPWTAYQQAFLEAHEERNPAFTARHKIKVLAFKDMDSYIKNFCKLTLLAPPDSFTDSKWVDRFCEKLPSRYHDLIHDIQQKNIVDNFEEVVQEARNFENGNVAAQSQLTDCTTKDPSSRQPTRFGAWKKVEHKPMLLHAASLKSTQNNQPKGARRSEPKKRTPTFPVPVADKNTKCYHCHKFGHFSRDCLQRTKRAGMHTLHTMTAVDQLPKINVQLPDGLWVFMLADTSASHNYVAGDFLEFL